jgi:predicted transcriptional regulator
MFCVTKKEFSAIVMGAKTALVAKRRTSLFEFPLKIYFYEKLGKLRNKENLGYTVYEHDGSGMVVGECLCKAVNCIALDNVDKSLEKSLKMNLRELSEYLDGEVGYIFFVSDVKKYKKPLPLSSFGRSKAPSIWCRVKE